ncbi:MAG: zinc-dependent alcohol dehydrogenase [Candidatus Dormibacteria bacterium]
MRALVVDPTQWRPPEKRRPQEDGSAPTALPLAFRDVGTPSPQMPGWVLVRPALSGICRTDLAMLHQTAGAAVLTAYERPAILVPGHEIVGVVEQTAKTRWAREGHRVIVEPTLRCAHKGLPECRRCRAGDGHLCENADRAGAICSGSGVGASERTGGGWSDAFLAHEDMLVPADGISDQRGVLAEPVASALHAAMRWTRRGDQAVVIGSGAFCRLLVATLRRLYADLNITVIYDSRSQYRPRAGRSARRADSAGPDRHTDFAAIRGLGASQVWHGRPEALVQRTAEHVGARMLRPRGGGLPVLDGGVDVVFDCRGTQESTDVSLRLLRAGGTLVLCGRASRTEVDLPLLWSRELTVCGAATYGHEANGRRTFAIVREWLTDASFPVDHIVTHRYPLEEFGRAIETATAGISVGAVKVVFQGPEAALQRPRYADYEMKKGDGNGGGSMPMFLEQSAARARTAKQQTAAGRR